MGLPDPDREEGTGPPDIVVVDKQKKEAMVIAIAVLSDINIRKKKYEKLDKYQGLKEELERT